MGIATEILSLRRNQTSSVKTLLGALEWTYAAPVGTHSVARAYAAAEAADIVLLNVAVHAAEALNQPTVRSTRRAALPTRRKSRRSDTGQLTNRIQRRLFA
jgi:hypothetical protein